MANLKEVRDRIKSVKNTQQITKAMKLVSASKLRKAQDAIQRMRPYANKQSEILENILSNLGGADVNISFGEERIVRSACIVVITSNRGLCGAFNSNIIKSAAATIREKYAEVRKNNQLTIIPIGKKGYDFFRKNYKDCKIIDRYVTLFDDLTFDNVSNVSKRLMTAFDERTYDAIEVSYSSFKNAAVQYPRTVTYLPVSKFEQEEEEQGKKRADYIFEPDTEGLLLNLVPSILHTTFYKFILDTHASEHGARMTAMDSATENANELLKELKLSYNKARQEAITNEILEIVGGAAALEAG